MTAHQDVIHHQLHNDYFLRSKGIYLSESRSSKKGKTGNFPTPGFGGVSEVAKMLQSKTGMLIPVPFPSRSNERCCTSRSYDSNLKNRYSCCKGSECR